MKSVKTDVRNLTADLEAAGQDDAEFAKSVKTQQAIAALQVSIADWERPRDTVEKIDKSVLTIAARALGKEVASKTYIDATETPVQIKSPKPAGVKLKLKAKT